MKFGEPIGSGSYKNVYDNPNDPYKVIKIHKRDNGIESPEFLKAQYYLAKILHILLPDNMPDAHAVYAPRPENNIKTTLQVVEKKYPDEVHKALSGILNRGAENNNPHLLGGSDKYEYVYLRNSVHNSPKVKKLYYQLLEIFYKDIIDKLGPNFALDENGNAIYLDDVMPWDDEFDMNGLMCEPHFNINLKVLKRNIDKIEDIHDRAFVSLCLDRLLFLYKEHKRKYAFKKPEEIKR